jgi:ribosomal protein S18 acetylase RimI-like enzyme
MAVAEPVRAYTLRRAEEPDASHVSELVDAAYGNYVDRIGRLPGPMTQDYRQVIRDSDVTIAVRGETLLGVLVLNVTDEGFVIENVAVRPTDRGLGLGKALLEVAEDEARRAGFTSIYLYTHEKMTENQALYTKIGYVEYDRRSQGDFALVYMRKRLG